MFRNLSESSLGSENSEVDQSPKWKKTLKSFLGNITVEPIALAYSISYSIEATASQNLLLQKSCYSNLNYTNEECDLFAADVVHNNVTSQIEIEAEKAVASINTWRPFPEYGIPCFLILILGSLSDVRGRKPTMILPILGITSCSIFLLLSTFFWHWSPELTTLLDVLSTALTGGRACINLATSSYLADVTSEKSRSVRMGIYVAMMRLGLTIGPSLTSVLYQYYGFYGVFGTMVAVNISCLLYTVFAIKEEVKDTNTGSFKQVFHYKNIIDPFKYAFKSRSGFGRCKILLVTLAFLFLEGPIIGEMSILYLFVREKFGWDEVQFGFYAAFKMSVLMLGTIVSAILFSFQLRMDDALVGVIVSVCLLTASILTVFANVGWLMYVVPFVGFFLGAGFGVIRTILSKIAHKSELGKVVALLGMLDSLTSVIVNPLYNVIYSSVLDVFPNGVFLLSVGLAVPSILTFSFVYFLNKKEEKYKENSTVDAIIKNINKMNLQNV